MRVPASDCLTGLKFCASAIRSTGHWASKLIFIRPKEIFVWDGETAARYPIETGVEITVRFDTVAAVVKKFTCGLAPNDLMFDVENGYLKINGEIVEEAFTEFGRMDEFDRRYTITLTDVAGLCKMLRVATVAVKPPGWMVSTVIVGDTAVISCDGRTVFYAANPRETRPLYQFKQSGGRNAVWLGWQFAKLLASQKDIPDQIKIGTLQASATWAHGGEVVSDCARYDSISEQVQEFVNPNDQPVAFDAKNVAKSLAKLQDENISSIGCHPYHDGMQLGLSIGCNLTWTGEAPPPDGWNDTPQFYLDSDRLRTILRFATAYDREDVRSANKAVSRKRLVRFYGTEPSAFTIALAIQVV